MHKLLGFAVGAVALILSGCSGFHSGTVTGSASLSQGNFTYVAQNALGSSKAIYFLGLGGAQVESMVGLAKKDLTQSHKLTSNQALANVTVSHKRIYKWWCGIIVHECTVTADIVEFR